MHWNQGSLQDMNNSSLYLKHGGIALSLWIQQVLNAIAEFESVPKSFELSIVIPVYKRDPLDMNSYRGTSLSQIRAKPIS